MQNSVKQKQESLAEFNKKKINNSINKPSNK